MEIIKRNSDYAIRAMICLCKDKKSESKSVRSVSLECEVPEIFLRKIFQKLVKSGLVSSSQGPKGGYSLSKDPKSITVLEIVEKIQGKFAINKCFLKKGSCPRENKCIIRNKLGPIQQQMLNILENVTLDVILGPVSSEYMANK